MIDEEMKALFERAKKVDPAQIGHYVLGGYMNGRIRPVTDDMVVIGPAFTVRLPYNDNAILYHAVEQAPEGSVIVIDRMGEDRFACIGEICALNAKMRGMAGMIVDGPNADTRALKTMGFPVFSTGRAPATNSLKGLGGEFNVAIHCGGAVVRPGDIVYGDLDGVIVAPPDEFEHLVETAEAATRDEVEFLKPMLLEGRHLTEVWNFERLSKMGINAAVAELLKVEGGMKV
ncbi:RraA family protein [Lachnospiraceae bacterium 62-35]